MIYFILVTFYMVFLGLYSNLKENKALLQEFDINQV